MTRKIETRSRRFDPERKARIVDAALALARESGLKDVTMRNVAARADVPLGSMSYHFASKSELVNSVVNAAREGTLRKTAGPFINLVANEGLPAAVAEMVVSLTGQNREQLIFEMDMFLLAMHDDEFQPESQRWADDLFSLIAPHADAGRAKEIALLVDGMCLNSAVIGSTYSRDEVEQMVRRVLAA